MPASPRLSVTFDSAAGDDFNKKVEISESPSLVISVISVGQRFFSVSCKDIRQYLMREIMKNK